MKIDMYKKKKYRVKRFVNYEKLTLLASHLAHEYKRLGYEKFLCKYEKQKYNGVYGKYLKAYIKYLENIHRGLIIKDRNFLIEKYLECNKYIIVEPDIYLYYFKYKENDIIEKELSNAILEFLEQGFFITKVQEAI